MHENEYTTGREPARPAAPLEIAIVGMACRFPGASDYGEYWQNLVARRNSIREVPADRWSWREYFGDPRAEPNKTRVKWGGFIDDIDKFDSLFFGIAPGEAAFIDPQHRLFLETAWHAVEDAGYSVGSLAGKAIGVYAGVSKNDYAELMRESGREIAPYVSTGTVHSILVNRVSFLFDLHGRSEAVDTACSSSLVALHNAIRDIASGECEAAIVGGVNALITPTMFISHSKSGMLSPDGQCRTFSASANGYVRSEGVGALFIKTLERAVADGDHVHAVIRSSAVNHGGRSNFLTSPTTEAQAAVVMKALARAGIDPRSVGYIETHGTGTPLGDPIEINGLKRAFAQLAAAFPATAGACEPHCALSAVKTNIGHLESAAGIAGIIKVVLAMKHRRIPAICNFDRINPYIELDGSPFYIATESIAWEAGETPRRAGVSSFGMGGVNAHVVLEEAPASQRAAADRRECVFPLSARKGRLRPYAESVADHLERYGVNEETPALAAGDVSFTLQTGRDAFEERLAVVATSADEVIAALRAYAAGEESPNLHSGEARVPNDAGDASADRPNAAEAASRWVRGEKIDWSAFHAGASPRRVPLPTYPFARRRCWFTDVPSRVTRAVQPDVIERGAAPDSRRRTVRPDDFFIRDHVVQGKAMLPGVVHLEFARATADASGGPSTRRVLKDVYWMTPVVVEGKEVELDVRLTPRGERTDFEVVQNGTVHSKGSIAAAPSAPENGSPVDLDAIRSRCKETTSRGGVYALLDRHGLAYGPTFQVIEQLAHNEQELIAELVLPSNACDSAGEYVLHPAITDGVFQAVTALSLLALRATAEQFVPFHLESAEIARPTGGRCFVHARVSDGHAAGKRILAFDATLTDAGGNVLVSIRNLQKRPLAERPEPAALTAASHDLWFKPLWRERELDHPAGGSSKPLLVFADDVTVAALTGAGVMPGTVQVRPGATYRRVSENVYEIAPGDAADYERLLAELRERGVAPARVAYLWGLAASGQADVHERLKRGIYGLFRFTQAALKARLRDGVSLVYVHSAEDELAGAIHSMAGGFARTLEYENPKFDYVTVGVDQPAIASLERVIEAELHAAPAAAALREVSYRNGRRYERAIVRDDAGVRRGDRVSPIKDGGVYVISGGAGGLGRVVSRHLAEAYRATVVWLGRSPMSDAIAAKAAEIETHGGRCEYISADITDRDAVTAAFARIRESHSSIDGVIHAAGLIEDAFILRKEAASFGRVVEPKIAGAINLDAVTQHDPLDFFVLFSSIAALMPNQGQCDYAAANSFLDAFAESRNRLVAAGARAGVSLAINWPLWAHGGIRVAPEEERHLLRAFGMRPLPTADGLEVFEAALAHAKTHFPDVHQAIAISGDRETIERSLGVASTVTFASTATSDAVGDIDTELRSIFARRLGVAPEAIARGKTIGELGVDSTSILGIVQDINRRFAAEFKPTLLFDINSVEKLSAHLSAIGKTATAAPAADAAPAWNRSLIDVDRSDAVRRIFRKTFQTSAFYLRDHVVDDQYNMPGACYVEMARQACDLLLGAGAVTTLLHNYWASPLSSRREDFIAQVELTPREDDVAYEIVSFSTTGERRLHAMGQCSRRAPADAKPAIDVAVIRSRCDEIQYPEKIYEQIRGEGLMVGPTFQPMTQIFLNDTEALGILELPEEVRSTAGEYVLHPALLTGVFQTALIGNRRHAGNTRRYIPIGMDEIEVLAPIPPECCVWSRTRPANARNDEMRKFDVDVCRPDGVVVARLKGFAIRALREQAAVAEAAATEVERSSRAAAADALFRSAEALIRSKLAGPIGLRADEIESAAGFDQYGVTSVMVVELNQELEEVFGPIPKTLFFEYRNVEELAEYFVENHRDALARLAAQPEEQHAGIAIGAAAAAADDDGADRLDDARAYLRSLIAGPIGVPADEIDFHTGFDQYGVNSVMVVQLNETFEAIFGPLSKTLFFEFRNIDELAGYFLEEHRERLLAALPPLQAMPGAPVVLNAPPGDERENRVGPTGTPAAVAVFAREHHDIAIVSAAGRFPGARTIEELWDVLREGRDCITEIPHDRFDYLRYYDADPERNGIYGRWGGFIEGVDLFDPGFFNISPREAELIDPQERLLLEVVWEMLERAGYTKQRLHSRSHGRVGVYVGALWQPYEGAGIEATLSGNVVGPSSLLYSIANRVSYFLDLAGPSMAIDTACSSSLTALHLACQSIRDGESEFAIAAGVNLSVTASKYLFLSRYRFLSTDGRCRSYGEGGDGYVPGEGVCALLLKPLPKAIADGDSVLAVIKGTAINHGGRTNGYTVPNPKSQASAIAQAVENAGIDPRAITYVEGHGTGTSLGDPVEIAGLEKALGLPNDGNSVCAIGSIKSNIGHLEAAAGIASLVKVILQMQHGMLVPSLHADRLNPNIDFGRSRFRVQRELAVWERPALTAAGSAARRCAGISSFGAGGSNAHVIVEEYDGPRPAPLSSSRPNADAICVFSARNEERLIDLVRRFRDYVTNVAPGDLHDIAYTLQTGREAMRERLAVVAPSTDALRAALDDFLEQRRERDDWRRGRVPGKGAQSGLSANADRDWWKEKTAFELAEGWVKGREIDWESFYGGRNYRIVPLPTYPFARERYWLDMAAGEPARIAAAMPQPAARVFHPLLHRNSSGADGPRYSSRFTGDEFFFTDHLVRIDGRTYEKVLPGVACLEMARAAIAHSLAAPADATTLELRNTIWAQPIVAGRATELSIALSPRSERQIDYTIYSDGAAGRTIHCQGRADWTPRTDSPRLDIARLEEETGGTNVEASSVYAAFIATGGLYGPSFQGITAIRQGGDALVARLRLPEVAKSTLDDYVLHPTLMDSALQAYLGMVDDWNEVSGQTRMPFALESLRIYAACTSEMFAWMRYSSGSRRGDRDVKLDVDLCDAQGRVCVRMNGFAVRALTGERARRSGERAANAARDDDHAPLPKGVVTLAPVWDAVSGEETEVPPGAGERVAVIGGSEEQRRAVIESCGAAVVVAFDEGTVVEEIAAGAKLDHLVWILPAGERRSDSEALIDAQEQGVLYGFRLIKALLREGYGTRELRWTVVTTAVARVAAMLAEELAPAHSSVHGLVGSMAKEHRNWRVRLIDVAGSVWPWHDILRLRWDERGDGRAYRNGQWYRRRLIECTLPEGGGAAFRRGGAYVIVGGAGGVGEVVTDYLIRNYDARVAWIGRRPKDGEIEKKIDRAAAARGQRPLYVSADARKRDQLERARAEIAAHYGRIDGVIHSAIVLSDKSLANMTEEQFGAALSTKVDTAVRLAQVFGRDALDFIVYFSSLQSFLKAPGQSNYAAGCTFTDAFAEWQSANAACPVKVMNWGYWGSVGIVAAPEYQERMARMGWGSLEPADGMDGLERVIAGPLPQIGMLRANGADAVDAIGVIPGEVMSIARDGVPSVPALADEARTVAVANGLDELRAREEQLRLFDETLANILRAELSKLAGAPLAEYDRWRSESLRILAARGHALDDGAEDVERVWREWEREKVRWDAAGMRAQARLAETALRGLVAVLRGEKRATDLLFPGSSLELVEGVYRNNAVADYLNAVMADVVRRYVDARRETAAPHAPATLRLLELGAGTGGSTLGILRKLDTCRESVGEYCYSDVSKHFVVHGERMYGAGREYLTYAVVDVERPLHEQGLQPGAYDVVVAANVLHATRRLRETLRNAKAALKRHGVLVLNEITAKSVFMHVTFGLLSGWWAYEDEDLRIEGSPGLAAETWQRVLAEEGFRSVGFPARDAAGLGQQIIVAESDGVIRQKRTRSDSPAPMVAVADTALAMTAAVRSSGEGGEDLALLRMVESWLVDSIVTLLKVRRQDVDVDAELSEFGFDSISLTGLANHVNQACSLELMPTVFFEHPTVSRFARHLVERHRERVAATIGGGTGTTSPSPSQPAAATAAARPVETETVEQWLMQAVGVLLKVRRENVDLDAELSEFGFDSISLTGLANHFNQAFALDLMPTIFFEHPTIRSFAAYLVRAHGERLAEKLGVRAQSIAAASAPRLHVVRDDASAAPADLEPIAIIGMSGRFPGADDLDAFWENLEAGRASIREIPAERWDWKALDRAQKENGTKGGARWGAFMEGVDQFDPLFFGISPREAERMDPQHRLTMMYGWKAFEDAGYGPKQLWGSRTGVFVGTTNTGYAELVVSPDGTGIEGYTATGLVPSVGPNRLSFLLNLHGPSEPVETACSSSLVAVHRAVRSIMAGECDMALAGGVNTLFPTLHLSFDKAGMLSPDGKCKTFSSRADGYARGEGVGMVVLKRLSAAERDGDHIHALIRSSAENHGGRAQSLTAPNPNAQADLIKDAYRRAGISPRSISYIEAHGTGTPLGDPIEINGLKSAFESLCEELGEETVAAHCGLGSVKTNIGHLELAAGIAGLLKIVLQLRHESLVRTLHCDEVNPYIRLDGSPFYIVDENRPWRRLSDGRGGEWPRRAGVSSFGFGGVNAHIVVEEYAGGAGAPHAAPIAPVPVVLSAKDGERLKEQATQLKAWIARRGAAAIDLRRLAYTLQVGREAMEHRIAMIVASIDDLDARLADFLEGRTAAERLYRGEARRGNETLALFSGDEELREAVGKWIRRGKWSKLLELWVRGLEIDWDLLYGDEKPRRLSLPTYPFAKERCWIDATARAGAQPSRAPLSVLHPLLHRNTSDLAEQRYSSTFTGDEFFLSDHRIRNGGGAEKILPGVAYLEMARAAVEQASPNHAGSVLELRDTVLLRPVVVTEPRQISITVAAVDDDRVDYEIHSGDAEQEIVHCQGQAVFSDPSDRRRIDLDRLRREMARRIEPSELYAQCEQMGLEYGPAHRAVASLHIGERQLLAQLRLPPDVESTGNGYVLHPSVMDAALQASLALLSETAGVSNAPRVPFGIDSLRILSGCTSEMAAWVRMTAGAAGQESALKVDIDVSDVQGNVCVEIRGLASRVLDRDVTAGERVAAGRIPIRRSADEAPVRFDDAFYEALVADVVSHRVSADDAADVE